MQNNPILFLVFVFLLISLGGCDSSRVFEKNEKFSANIWQYENSVRFEVDIQDTSELYNMYVNIRHSDHFKYRNLWIQIHNIFPNGQKSTSKVNLPLANSAGKWHGKCLGDICDAQILIQEKAFFPNEGTYRFEIEQSMRDNPLPNVMGVGLRIEKSGIKADFKE